MPQRRHHSWPNSKSSENQSSKLDMCVEVSPSLVKATNKRIQENCFSMQMAIANMVAMSNGVNITDVSLINSKFKHRCEN